MTTATQETPQPPAATADDAPAKIAALESKLAAALLDVEKAKTAAAEALASTKPKPADPPKVEEPAKPDDAAKALAAAQAKIAELEALAGDGRAWREGRSKDLAARAAKIPQGSPFSSQWALAGDDLRKQEIVLAAFEANTQMQSSALLVSGAPGAGGTDVQSMINAGIGVDQIKKAHPDAWAKFVSTGSTSTRGTRPSDGAAAIFG